MAVIEHLQILKLISRKTVVEHLTAQLRVGGLHRYVDGSQLHTDDSLYVPLLHIGQGNVISLQERKPGIVVLKIQGLPHPRRHLVDKAEYAFVAARTVIAHQAVFKLHPQVIIILLVDFQQPLFSVRFSYDHLNVLILNQIPVVKYILNHFMID